MEDKYFEEERYIKAQKRVKRIKGFYWHLFWYLVVNAFILLTAYNNSDSWEAFFTFGIFSTAIFWGIGLLAHGMSTFGKNIIFSKDWEDRKIKEIMDKDKYDY